MADFRDRVWLKNTQKAVLQFIKPTIFGGGSHPNSLSEFFIWYQIRESHGWMAKAMLFIIVITLTNEYIQ